jgi:hypothetical protein
MSRWKIVFTAASLMVVNRGLGAKGGEEAGAAGEVVADFEGEPIGEEIAGGQRADFEDDASAGLENVAGLGGKNAIGIEAVGTGEEGEGGLVVADLALECGLVGEGNVGGIGHEQVEGGGAEGGEPMGLDEVDGGFVSDGVLAGDGEGPGTEIDGDDGAAEFGGEGDTDGAGAGAGVSDGAEGLWEGEDELDEVFGFGPGDEDAGGYLEVTGEEFLAAGDVLDGFAGDALVEVAAVVDPGEFGEGVAGVAEKENALFLERVHEKEFGGEAGGLDAGFGEDFDALHEGLADGEIRRHS